MPVPGGRAGHIDLPVGAQRNALSVTQGAGGDQTITSGRADTVRVQGDKIARWVLLVHQVAPRAPIAGPELHNRPL
jgi:hypothetical protein